MTSTPTQEIFLGRQPILDRKGNLEAYELLFRSGNANSASFVNGSVATATVINHAFANLGLESVLGQYRGFINFDLDLLMSDMISLLPKDKIVIELLETIKVTDSVLERVRSLKKQGYVIALDDYIGDEIDKAALLPLVDIVKVEIAAMTSPVLAAETRKLSRLPVQLLAEKVDTRDQVDACLSLGYDLFQGYYFAKPSIISGRRLSPAATAIMQLTGLVVRDAETEEIERIFRKNPDLTVNLLRIVNSVAVGARQRITSVNHALVVLGRSQLNRWLQVLMFALGNAPGVKHPSPLATLAITRARLMESLAAELDAGNPETRERAFMAGILSLAEALLGIPMVEILQPLPLVTEVKNALLDRTGQLGELLNLCIALESADANSISVALKLFPDLTTEIINLAQIEAMEWANNLEQPAT